MLFVGQRTTGGRRGGAPRLASSPDAIRRSACVLGFFAGTVGSRAAIRRGADRCRAKIGMDGRPESSAKFSDPSPIAKAGVHTWVLQADFRTTSRSRCAQFRGISPPVDKVGYWLLDSANSNHTWPCSGTAPPPPSPTRAACRPVLCKRVITYHYMRQPLL